jgi:hypothetical protein
MMFTSFDSTAGPAADRPYALLVEALARRLVQGRRPLPGTDRTAAATPRQVLVEPGQALPGLEGFLHSPPGTGDTYQGVQRHQLGGMAAVVGQFAGGSVAADQQLAPS